jgi:hypothetical protein
MYASTIAHSLYLTLIANFLVSCVVIGFNHITRTAALVSTKPLLECIISMHGNITTGHRRYDHWFIGCSYRIDIEPYFTAANGMVGTMSLLPPQSPSAGVTDDPLRLTG